MAQQKGGRAARFRAQQKPPRGSKIERPGRTPHLRDDRANPLRLNPFLHRPQHLRDTARAHQNNPGGVEPEARQPFRIGSAGFPAAIGFRDPEHRPGAPGRETGQQRGGKPGQRAAGPAFRACRLMQRAAWHAGGGEQPVETGNAGEKAGRTLPVCGGGRVRPELRLAGEASLESRNAAAQLDKERSVRIGSGHGNHFCSCYVLIDSETRGQSQAPRHRHTAEDAMTSQQSHSRDRRAMPPQVVACKEN